MREKKRYIVFEVIADKKLSFSNVAEKIFQQNLEFLGELGCARSGLMVLDEWKQNKGILKVNNKYLNETRAALALIKEINNQKVIVKTVGVSGILKKAKEKFLIGG